MSNKTITLNKDKMKSWGELTKDCLAAITKQKVEFATLIGKIDYLIFYVYDVNSQWNMMIQEIKMKFIIQVKL